MRSPNSSTRHPFILEMPPNPINEDNSRSAAGASTRVPKWSFGERPSVLRGNFERLNQRRRD